MTEDADRADMMAQKKETARKWLERLYLLLAGVYLLLLTFRSTTYYLPFPRGFEKNIFLLLLGTVSAKSLVCLSDRQHLQDLLCAVLTGVACALTYRSVGYPFLLFLGVLTTGAVGVHYKKLLKLYVLAVGAVLLLAILGSMGGAIDNFVYLKAGVVRSAWGICYPTDLASYFVYLSVVLWILGDTAPVWAVLMLPVLSFVISRFVAGSTTSAYCSVLLLLMMLWQTADDRFAESSRGWKRTEKLVDGFSVTAFPICAACMFLMMLAYRSGAAFAHAANSRMSGRLGLAVNALQEHGIRLLGSSFEQIGGGFSTFINKNYNFVDSAYPLMLIRYGALFFLIVMLLWVRMSCQAAQGGRRRLMLGLALIAFHSFSEHHFTEVNYNIMLLLPFAAMRPDQAAVKGGTEARPHSVLETVPCRFGGYWGRGTCRRGRIAAACAVPLLAWLAFPRCLSWMRTLCTKTGLSGGGRNGVIVCLVLLCLLIVSGLFLLSLLALVCAPREEKKLRISASVLSVLCLAVLLGVYAKCDRMIDDAEEQYRALLDADLPAMETIIAAKTGRVCVDRLPELYRRRFGGVSSSVFAGDELARAENISVVMARSHDSKCFISRGFLYTEISDYHSIYTNDAAVIAALKQSGYQLRGYYNTEKSVDLKAEAEANALAYSEESGVRTEGPAHSLLHGPYLNLWKGKYTVRYVLQLPETSMPQNSADTPVAVLRVSTACGQEIASAKQIRCGDFSEDGLLTVEIPFSIEESIGVEFLMLTEEGQSAFIREITYRKTPDYDVHSTYNSRYQKIRDEYYNDEGEADILPEGYFAVEYGYDSAGNVSVFRYYDPADRPVQLIYGYAELRRTYNEKKQVVREEYYDVQGKVTTRPAGQASVERSYDETGNIASERYYDAEGKPVQLSYGYAEVHRMYNEKRQLIREEYYDTEGKPMTLDTGQASVEKEYDEAGNVAVERYYDAEGKPVQLSHGYAELRRTYDEKNQIIRTEYYDISGELIIIH